MPMMPMFRQFCRVAHLHPRLLISLAIGAAAAFALPEDGYTRGVTRWILAWNAGAWLYLLLTGWMMVHENQEKMRHRARTQDEGARTILMLVALASLSSLWAIIAELSVAKDFQGSLRLLHICLAVATIMSSWAFTQVMFALHYAHEYYAAIERKQPGGLTFPDTQEPDYLDFLYFSVVIGTSGQTADVAFSSSPMRHVGMAHCVFAFVFNTSLVGLMINVASGLL